MTKEEAINIIDNEIACVMSDCDRKCENCSLVKDQNEIVEAFMLANKALCESMPKKVNNKGVPTFHWIGGELGYCSNCGHKGVASDIWTGCNDELYCPNCGAIME